MQVCRINKFTPFFERKLTQKEEYDYKQNAIKPALDYLGTKEVSMIIHGTSFPESEKDIGVGTPYGDCARNFISKIMLHGFNSIQLGPIGVIRDVQHISPYKSTVSTRNYLFLDFQKLTQKRYGNLLTERDLEILNKPKTTDKAYSYSNFLDAFENHRFLIKKAYKNYKTGLKLNDENIKNLAQDFNMFKVTKGKIVSKDALFDVLARAYSTDDFCKWNEQDRDLIKNLQNRDENAIKRFRQIKSRSEEDYESYIFAQFLLDKQIKENTQMRKDLGFKHISDLLVGFSKSDEWANQKLFLKEYRMGCPHGGKYGPQLWDIPVLDPKKLFNADGSLGKAGLYLRHKLIQALEDFDNTRIDHALGLIDPYIYDKNSVEISNDRLNFAKFNASNISNRPDIDPDKNYQKVLNEIIIPTLNIFGIDKNYPVWEDLCSDTWVFNKIYHEDNNLPGITQLEWMRAQQSQDEHDWGLVGSHDSDPATQMIKKDWVRNGDAWNIFYLAGFLNSNPKRSEQRDEFCKKIAENDIERVKAKFAELFLTCKKIQISFADFFGIDKTYNNSGTENNTNWKLRLSKDYEDIYYKNLSSENPTALNIAEILKMAVQAKADMDFVKDMQDLNYKNDGIVKTNSDDVQKIIDNLDRYEKILKE